MKRCRHENADHLHTGEGWALMNGTPMPDALCEQFRCLDCGAWLPLGPSRDDGEHAEAVGIEIDAARLAADPLGVGCVASPSEWYGWLAHANEVETGLEHSGGFASGYLARQIADGDDRP